MQCSVKKLGFPFGPDAQHEQHRRFLTALKGYVVASSYFHKSLRWKREIGSLLSHTDQSRSGF